MTNTIERRVTALEQIVAVCFPKAVEKRQEAIVELVQAIVGSEFELKRHILLNDARPANLVWPRHIAIKLASEFSGLSNVALAPLFNRKDHTTIANAIHSIEHEEAVSKANAKLINDLRQRVEKALELGVNGV